MKKTSKTKDKESVYEFSIVKKEHIVKEYTLLEAKDRLTELERKIADTITNRNILNNKIEELKSECEELSEVNK
jgi:hypothetical protein